MYTTSPLAGFQPDILGERLTLDRLRAADGVDGVTKRLLLAAWSLEPDDLCDLILRAASDFPSDPAINVLWNLPCPSNDARLRWGRLVGDMIRITNRSDDRRTQDLLAKLHDLTACHRKTTIARGRIEAAPRLIACPTARIQSVWPICTASKAYRRSKEEIQESGRLFVRAGAGGASGQHR